MSTLSKAISFLFEKRGQADGQSINVKTIEGDEFTRETEFYQLPGISSGITPGSQCVIQEIEGGYSVIVASHNYNLAVSVTGGQTKIYSTNASGTVKQAEIFLDTNGKIKLSNTTESLKSVIDSLIDELIAFKTFGAPTNHATDPATVINLQTIKTRIGSLLF